MYAHSFEFKEEAKYELKSIIMVKEYFKYEENEVDKSSDN